MIEINPLLFVYGTLLNEKNEYSAFLKKNCLYVSEAKFMGKLYDLGDYPGALAMNNAVFFVYGSVFEMKDPEKVLKTLDEYEGFGDEYEQPNLFIRELTTVETPDQLLTCWVYLYNLPVAGVKQIPSGKYRGWNIF
jgi:gamma-glutamylcyclotransferase (GGCT)/AIG2-like uncharacterized protein YtfP